MVIPVHPAPGLGDLLPGFYVVPQNPIRDAGTPIKATVTAKANGAIVKVPSMGELLPGMFAVPQNPLRQALASPPGSGVPGTKGMGCGTCHGMGDATGLMGSLASAGSGITGWLQNQNTVAGITLPNWAWAGLGVVTYFLLAPGGQEYHAVRARSRGYRRLATRLAPPN